ncbi:MAG TPA: 7-cyano-7-deazaguanine synthase QueC [Blastocatellia bacterium]|nr:7-cyano-7-deazaguanine synthase QueC [Blastocatellia bacterium]
MAERPLAICLLSGGMDSCVTAAIARQQYECAFLHVTYGQRTAKRERRAFDGMADFYGVTKRMVADIDYLTKIGGSSLTDKHIAVAEADLSSKTVPSSYVPFRNTHLIAIAVSWAEVMGASKIFIGAVAEDSSGYPDCRPEYYEAFNKLIDVGTKPETKIEIVTPVINLSKSEIVKTGLELGAPLHLSYSCYSDEEMACGRCDSCFLRRRAFLQAGQEDDVIPYRVPLSEFRDQLGAEYVLSAG